MVASETKIMEDAIVFGELKNGEGPKYQTVPEDPNAKQKERIIFKQRRKAEKRAKFN